MPQPFRGAALAAAPRITGMKRRTLLETGYGALHDLVLAGFDADESDWPGIDYPSPSTP